ncbi:MAG: trypsin-like peptidase domain-containing protein [Bacteriovoracaceae bacterium]|nr:trypsin-like peptidase domain-containing protein [Bacteriovoracaceae bacterium]
MFLFITVSYFLINSQHAFSFTIPKVIYGTDNRMEVAKYDNSTFQEFARSTAGMIERENLILQDDGTYTIKAKTLGQAMNLCPQELFRDQLTAVNCSGFLVAPDILITAGHCVNAYDFCSSQKWIFDFVKGVTSLNKDSIYGCKEVLHKEQSAITKADYAIVRLDRPVLDRSPLEFRTEGTISQDEQVVLAGHPSGLPTKITDNAAVRSITGDVYFTVNIDSFAGNSGSPIFNKETGVVEGILVRGEQDYAYKPAESCVTVNVCKEDECRGEDVTNITFISSKILELLQPEGR